MSVYVCVCMCVCEVVSRETTHKEKRRRDFASSSSEFAGYYYNQFQHVRAVISNSTLTVPQRIVVRTSLHLHCEWQCGNDLCAIVALWRCIILLLRSQCACSCMHAHASSRSKLATFIVMHPFNVYTHALP